MIYVVEYWWRKGGYNDDYKLKTGNILKEKYRKGESFKEFLKISNIRSGDTFTNQTLTWDHIWTKDRSSPSILKIPHCIIEMARTYIFILAKVFLNQGGTCYQFRWLIGLLLKTDFTWNWPETKVTHLHPFDRRVVGFPTLQQSAIAERPKTSINITS